MLYAARAEKSQIKSLLAPDSRSDGMRKCWVEKRKDRSAGGDGIGFANKKDAALPRLSVHQRTSRTAS
ncbi:MAG: hypothetical protein DMG63_16025 [Acidobacteria bacterium]|nr:MAG: hypothetical protein DMG63_16025 [Acidobacteriota bacterium]